MGISSRKFTTPLHRAIASGDFAEVTTLVNAGADVNAQDKEFSPLHLAAEGGNAVMVAALIRAGADVNVWGGPSWEHITPLHIAARSGDVAAIAALINAGGDVNARHVTSDMFEDIGGDTPLHWAKTANAVRFLIRAGADTEARDANLKTPLHEAARYGYADAVNALVRAGADVNAQGRYDREDTPLHGAADSDSVDMISLLVKAGAGVNTRGDNGATPLHKVADRFGGADAVAALLRAGANVNAHDADGATPMHLASEEDVIAALAEAGADVNAKDSNGDTPLHQAVRRNNSSTVAALIKTGADVNAQNNEQLTPMDFAIYADEEDVDDVVELLMDAGAAHRAGNDRQDTALHIKALWGRNFGISELIAEIGVNARGKCMSTPLHRAASRGREDENYNYGLVSDLIKAGADVNAKDDKGRTPLDLAIIGCHKGAAESLRKAGAVANTQPDRQDTPLHKSYLKPEEVSAFIDGGADVNAQDEEKITPLHLARSADVVSLLVGAGADVNATNKWQQTPLHWVSPLSTAFAALVRAGADVNAKDKNQSTPLHSAVRNIFDSIVTDAFFVSAIIKSGGKITVKGQDDSQGEPEASADNAQDDSQDTPKPNVDFVSALVSAGADVNAQDDFQDTPLHIAVRKGSLPIVSALITAGADANLQNANQHTPLHVAADKGRLEVVVALIEGGADVNAQSIYQITPLYLALRRKHKDVAAALVKAGAEVIVSPHELLSNVKRQQPAHAAPIVGGKSMRIVVGRSDGDDVRVENNTVGVRHCTLTVAAGQLFVEDENDSGEVKIKDGGEWRTVTDAVAITPDTVLMLGEYEVLARDLLARYPGALVLFGESSGASHDARESDEGGIRRNPETGEIEGR